MAIIEVVRVYMTNFGQVAEDRLCADLAAELRLARWTKSGRPDGRSKRSLQAWARLEQWMQTRWQEAG